jgi:hypothetical protein
MEPNEASLKWYALVVAAVQVFGLGMAVFVSALTLVVAHEPSTPMPFSWPAHHSLYLHTDGVTAAECTIDDRVTAPFTISIPEDLPAAQTPGHQLAALDVGPATVTCTEPVTAVLDPNPLYALSGDRESNVLLAVGVFLTVVPLRVQRLIHRRRRRIRAEAKRG